MELYGRDPNLGDELLNWEMMLQNRDVYQKDPSTRKLVNEGVARVTDEKGNDEKTVLRYELETFVCEGQYENGLAHILETYLKNIDQAQQPAAWVSGFFGSGKSHFVKMLRALWLDLEFDDGATARGIADLPQHIRDQLKELSTRSKRSGGLHAVSGTLGSGAAGSVRLALLSLVFKSADLPEICSVARFVMWLRTESIDRQVREYIEREGLDWEGELDNFYVAVGLHRALVHTKPALFSSPSSCAEILKNQYPMVSDISTSEMVKTIRQSLTINEKFPLTLIALDEMQQYIGEDSDRSIKVQEVVEACSKEFEGKLLFIGTGQTAVSGTSNLRKLEGRFTIRIELSDTDVDAVVRKVILAKKPEAKLPLEQVMQANQGELSRQLSGTAIGYRQEDSFCFSQDYPILPVRRRFWEHALRILDQTGTSSQLRNQLGTVYKAIQTNLDFPLGHVVPADFLYIDSIDRLLQLRILPRKVYEKTMLWLKGSEEDRLLARACGLIFLINKLASSDREIGIRANVDTLADLMVEDLAQGSGLLRGTLQTLLDKCEILMKVGEDYRIQTEESTVWNNEFQSQLTVLSNEIHRINSERDERIQKKLREKLQKLKFSQGESLVSREIFPIFENLLPPDATRRVYLWARDGWSSDENSVRADSQNAGIDSPTIFVFIPKNSPDALLHNLLDYKAASTTLDRRGIPVTPEGIEAKAAMETMKESAERKIDEFLEDSFAGVRIFQAGGAEVVGKNLEEKVRQAVESSLDRLYPKFYVADHKEWGKVYDKAHKGAPDALKAVSHEGEAAQNPVCKEIMGMIAGGKKGAEIRACFEGSPYGWSRDAVDGGLLVLLQAGLLRALDERRQTIELKSLDRAAIGKTEFKVEVTTVTLDQRLQVRKLFQKLGVSAVPNEELSSVPPFLLKLEELVNRAGGEPPRLVCPDNSFLEEIRRASGNEQLVRLYDMREMLTRNIEEWKRLSDEIDKRWPAWESMKRLLTHAEGLPGTEEFKKRVEFIQDQRQLLETPDPVAPIVADLTQRLREELNRLSGEYDACHREGMDRLRIDFHWKELSPEKQHELLSAEMLHEAVRPEIKVQSTEQVLSTLNRISLERFSDRVSAISSRFDRVSDSAAKLCEPEAQFIHLPRRTLKTEAEIDTWIEEVKKTCKLALEAGPIVIQ